MNCGLLILDYAVYLCLFVAHGMRGTTNIVPKVTQGSRLHTLAFIAYRYPT